YTGALSDGGETVRLRGRVGEVIQEFTYSDGWYPQTDGQGWSLTAADTAQPLAAYGTKEGWRASEPANGTPGGTDGGVRANSVVINEIMTNAAGSPASGDWIELRNTTGSAVNIGNWWLSDSRDNLKKWRVPAGTSVPANGYLVFTQSQFGGAFELNSSGEGVFLSSGDAAGNLGGYRVDETFAASDPGVTFGRHVKSTGGADFTALVSPTQGAANAAPLVGPVVINEIMYSPAGGKAEYIELRNLTGSTVLLHDPANSSVTWKFTGGVDFALPAGASIPAFGYAVVSAIDPATFRAQYSVPAGVSVWGPYTLANGTNVLSDGGESIRLSRPGAPDGTSVRPYVQVDRVAYDDEAPWPSETNGTGRPLARRTGTAYGNDPVNWEAEAVNGSPGRSNFSSDTTAPTADVVDVAPDPRTTVVDSVTITFSEPVLGLDLADLRLTLNGGASLLTAAQTLTTTDNVTWTVGNLGGLTGTAGTYLFTLVAAGSGVTDTAGNPLAANASDTWQKNNADTTAPTADIIDVTPDPRNTAVGTVTIAFSEPVVGFDLADLRLTRDGGGNLLTASQTLATSDGGRTWTLGNLAGLTGTGGGYALTLTAPGGIADAAGNPLAAGATDTWVTDTAAPTTDVVDVTPDPRNSAVNTITIVFSEPVINFALNRMILRRDATEVPLTASQTLTTTDNATWTLGNLAGLTAADGTYVLAVPSGIITDATGNVAGSASDTWVKDSGAPTADVVDVSPDPRRTPVGSIGVAFSEPVTGVDVGDFRLTRNGAPVDLSGAGLVPASGSNPWNITNLLSLTAAPGTYVLTFVAAGSGVTDAAGNPVSGDASDTWVVDTAAPTVDVVDVTPDPRASAIDFVSVQFNEEVTGFDIADLRLTRDGGPNLITGAQTLTKLAGGPGSWVVGNLAVLTAEPGDYVLTVVASGSGIVDAAGNALAADGSDGWRTNAPDGDAPSVQILPVSPDPRNTAVAQITVLFSEPVVGFDLADLVLTRDGRGGFLGGPATLNTTDGGRTWTVGGLTTLTDDAGDYSLILDARGSGIQDAAGNALPVGATEQWTLDLTGPTVDVVDVAPDPRGTPVDSVQIVFSEPVTGFDLSDLTLIPRNGPANNLLTAAQTLTTSDGGRTWTLGNLAGLTSPVHGGNLVAVNASGSGIRDAAGNALAAGAFDDWIATAVFGRHVFYNGSGLDGGSDLANAADDGAVAADKRALLPGQVGSFANITSYRDGINGIMVDIAGLPLAGQQSGLQPGDFVFKSGTGGDPATWQDAPAPTIHVRPGAGVGGSDRVTFVWPDGAIRNTWLQVTVRPTPRTGLVAADTFYVGNLVGEVGNSTTNATVNAIDMALTRRNLFSTEPAAVAKYDFDRDGRIGVRDMALGRSNLYQSIALLNAPAAPAPAPAPAPVFSDAPVSPLSASRVWDEAVADVI
ncbi:MAG TPA: Ig-like domain-containing protein, partial [Tepidisphaeraceae bacterium]|nr:Ig-like domain-containing protein [Tepidisphaeraceae bacterium]